MMRERLCVNMHYARSCCRTCYENKMLDEKEVVKLVLGSSWQDGDKYSILRVDDGRRICLIPKLATRVGDE